MITQRKVKLGDKEYETFNRLTAVDVAVEPSLEAGEVRFYPKANLLLVGPGVGVDSDPEAPAAPAAPTKSIADLRAELAKLKEADEAKEIEAEIAKRKAAQTPQPIPDKPAADQGVQA
jgi:hypothetical protein